MSGLHSTWLIFALGSAFFAALTALFGKLGVADINSNLATFIRTLVIMIVTAGIVSWRSEWQRLDSLTARSFLFLILSGLATGLSWICYFRALQLGPVSKVAPVDKLSIVFVIVLAALFLGESLSLKTFIGALLVTAGAFVLAL